jgi:hypothetical protein
MNRGVQELRECLDLLLADIRELKREVDATAPLTAEQLCERWKVAGTEPEDRLFNLARKCREWGLQAMKGTRGWHALYARPAVLAAEAYAAGTSKRRRAA